MSNWIAEDTIAIIRKGNWLLYNAHFDLPQREHEILARALTKGLITEDQLRNAVHEGLCAEGRRCYTKHISNPRAFPTYHWSAEALGYAIKHGRVTDDETAFIIFRHNDTIAHLLNLSEKLLEHAMKYMRDY